MCSPPRCSGAGRPLESIDPADASEAGVLLDAYASADEAEMERDFPGFKAFRDRIRAAIADGRIEEVSWMRAPRPTIVVDASDVVRLGDRDWVAVYTPGHTHDHLCMWSPEDGVLLSGDHVLPTITPHIAGPTLDRYVDATAFALRNLRAYAAGSPLAAVITPEVYDRST